ncbi:MAG TPA: AMIN domain-containing protein [Vicinamibacterales bacterium]|nr:AMIN domain-containing protein [Vicinamibacterales bacterium]
MRRMWSAVIAVAVLISALPAFAIGTVATSGEGAVRSLSVVPSTGRTEVVMAVRGDVGVQDFMLGAPDRIVVDVTGATLGLMPRLYDKVARGGITNVRVAQYKSDVVRLVIELDGKREYSIVRGQDELRITIEGVTAPFKAWTSAAAEDAVASIPAAASMARGRPGYEAVQQSQQPRMTVTYQDADIRDVLAAFATFSGRTIVVGKAVSGKVSAEIRDQPWDVALRAILEAQGFAAAEDPNTGIITVDSYENIGSKQAAEPLATQLVSINYARAASLVGTISNLLSRDCSKPGSTMMSGGGSVSSGCLVRGNVSADTATNTLIITEAASRIGDLLGYVQALDVRTPQVAIKAKIIFVNRTDIEDLGITYDLGTQTQFFNRLVTRTDPTTFTPVDRNGDGVPDAVGGGTPFAPDVNIIDLGGNQLSGVANANQRVAGPALSLIFSTALGKFDLTAFIDALQEVRLADIEAEPSIVTLDNRQASILVGEETPIRVIDASSASGTGGVARATVSFKESGIMLQVTPHITNNRQILMTLHSERSSLQAAASDVGFTFNKQRADNQLLVNDGETAVIGGLTVTEVSVSKVGIPILVDLPLIGRLFGQTRSQEDKRDLLILVTPHIVDEGESVGSVSPTGR